MRLLLVRGYKDRRGLFPIDIGPIAHDAYTNIDMASAIERALKAEGLTEDDVISMSVVPSEINGRDTGSTDFHILCRSGKPSNQRPDA